MVQERSFVPASSGVCVCFRRTRGSRRENYRCCEGPDRLGHCGSRCYRHQHTNQRQTDHYHRSGWRVYVSGFISASAKPRQCYRLWTSGRGDVFGCFCGSSGNEVRYDSRNSPNEEWTANSPRKRRAAPTARGGSPNLRAFISPVF
jgi:hypothetical protein